VLTNLRPAGILRHDLYQIAPALPSYLHGNVVLIGDAAHAMTRIWGVARARHWSTR
jgi:2-polyprenyl-6-methoxyphenol hydroxylase-like FAD-dependent oxidoreductase